MGGLDSAGPASGEAAAPRTENARNKNIRFISNSIFAAKVDSDFEETLKIESLCVSRFLSTRSAVCFDKAMCHGGLKGRMACKSFVTEIATICKT